LKLDQIDTPPPIAERMVEAASFNGSGIAADFAVGRGALLEQAAKRWPTARIIGVDVCRSRVRNLQRSRPSWKIGVADFLKKQSRVQCRPIKSIEGKVSAIFLNPPFSCRGTRTIKSYCGDELVTSSLAMGFVLQSLSYLHPLGELIAVLPAGILSGEKDQQALRLIESNFSMNVIEVCDSHSFEGFFVRTLIVRIEPKSQQLSIQAEPIRTSNKSPADVSVIRGRLPMYKVKSDFSFDHVPLIHTTALIGNKLQQSPYRTHRRHAIQGPMVLLPRVGEPSAQKVVVVGHECSIALSDCVIALKCYHLDQAFLLYSSILQNWDALCRLYGGTCAKYVTLGKVVTFLEEELGFTVSIGRQSDMPKSEVLYPQVELQADHS
jgi:tRNA1(Val) A37 N6-methylase TrmN6